MAALDLEQFQELIGIQFTDQSLLVRALTHKSYLNENPRRALEDNQRLEFLGDAILDFISGEWLYDHFPDASEGRLTRLRAALVRTETLASFAQDCRIGQAVLLGRGEEDSGGRERTANLCDAFEALVGALYLDKSLEDVRDFVYTRFESAIQDILDGERDTDAKSLLQEWSQRYLGLTPTYRTVSSSGPDHARQFTVVVMIGDKPFGEGIGPRKQVAAQFAARQALDHLQSEYQP